MARTVVLTEAAIKALQEHSLSKVENATFWSLVGTMPPTGQIISHAELEKKVAATNLGPIMKRLCEMGFLMRGPKAGVSYHYKLNPAYFRILS
jgi:hypothetical protein